MNASQLKIMAAKGRNQLNRRSFLKNTLGAAAVAPLIQQGLRAAENAAGAGTAAPGKIERKIKLGAVGCGGRGGWIAGLFKKHGGYEMHAVADYFPGVAKACGDALGVAGERRFSGLSGYRKLMESGVEAVLLETPPYFFPEHARTAVELGLHVYMAKPIAVDVPGCLVVEAAAKKATASRKCFMVDYQAPTDPHNREVVRLVKAGEIGKIGAINSHYFAGTFADTPLTNNIESRLRNLTWCNDVALGGGYHVNACIHAVDADLWLAGRRPVSAMASSRLMRADPHGDSHDFFSVIFEFEDGLMISHRGKHQANRGSFDVVCGIQGTTGWAQIGYTGKAILGGGENGYQGEIANLYEAGAVRNIATFYQAVVAGDYSNPTVQRSVDGALATILAREAGLRHAKMTMAELLQENRSLPVDLAGLKA